MALTLDDLAARLTSLERSVESLTTHVAALSKALGDPMSIGGPLSLPVGQSSTLSIVATAGGNPTTNLPGVPQWVATNPAALTVTPAPDGMTAIVTVTAGFAPGDGGSIHLVVGALTDDLAVTVVAGVLPVADKVQIAFTPPA